MRLFFYENHGRLKRFTPNRASQMRSFVQYLDQFREREYIDADEYVRLSAAISTNFLETAPSPGPPPIFGGGFGKSKDVDEGEEFYDAFSRSRWNLSEQVPKQTPKPDVVRVSVKIDARVQCLGDLLAIARDHPLRVDTDYNIDIAALHRITGEIAELDAMVGMCDLKRSVLDQLIYFMQSLHVGKIADYKHTVIYGPPGTGKTEVAKILGRMYSKIGVLAAKTFRKATRTDMVAGFLGQTAIKTRALVDDCVGGVLFVDEVYSLCSASESPDVFAKECVDTLCEALSDHRDDLMVIVAGYEEEIKKSFFAMNQGLASRFIWRFRTEAYTAPELARIFAKKVADNGWTVETPELAPWFGAHLADFKFFGRDMELLLTYTKIAHGRRIFGAATDEVKKRISLADMDAGLATFRANGDKREERTEIFGLYT